MSLEVDVPSFQEKILDFEDQIPARHAFKISEVSQICDVKNYVLRHWETEFPDLKPKKSHNNQRMYTRVDVLHCLSIRYLVHEVGLSIPNARRFLLQNKKRTQKHISPTELTELKLKYEQLQKEIASFKNYFQEL